MQRPGRNITRNVSLLGGFCFFLSALEFMVPKPLPFIRLGLANLPLLLALDIMPFPSFLLLGALKIIGQALISGTLFSYVFLFSLGGTGLSALLMYALRKGLGKEQISLIGVSAAGALSSNGVQLVLAYYFVFGNSVRYAAAPILALGLVTGTLLGIGAEYFIRRSQWYAGAANLSAPPRENNQDIGHDKVTRTETVPEKRFERFRKARENFCLKTFGSGELAVAGLCMMPALLLNPDTGARIVQSFFFWALAWLSGRKNNPIITVSVMLGIILFNLFVPYGEVLFAIGPLTITSGALWGGLRRAVTLEGLFMLSRCCVRRDLSLPGSFGEITGDSFRVFSRLTEEKQLFSRANWAGRLDGLLFSMGNEAAWDNVTTTKAASEAGGKKEPGKTGVTSVHSRLPGRTIGPRIIILAGVILAWLPFLLTLRVFARR